MDFVKGCWNSTSEITNRKYFKKCRFQKSKNDNIEDDDKEEQQGENKTTKEKSIIRFRN